MLGRWDESVIGTTILKVCHFSIEWNVHTKETKKRWTRCWENYSYSSLIGNFISFPYSINIIENSDKVIKELSTDQKNCYSFRLMKAMKTRVLPQS